MRNEKKTIFLVDDDITNLTVGKKALQDTYKVFALNSGEALITMLNQKQADLILLDVNMPDMSGYDVIKVLKEQEHTAHIPVVFLTSMNDTETELEGLSLGAVDYISKPFSPPLLLKRLEIHMTLEAQRRELLDFNTNLAGMVADKTSEVVELKNAILAIMAEIVEERDEGTGGHIARTQLYTKALIQAMKEHVLYEDLVQDIDEFMMLQSCQLHDVGKVGVPDAILNKPGKLTDEEFAQIKLHPQIGERIIHKIEKRTSDSKFLEYARVFALSHHEKWDGSGYPHGLKGEEIPLLGRVMAIADVYDALITNRPYKKAFSHVQAVGIILEGRGKHFDPVLTDIFEEIHTQFEQIADEVKETYEVAEQS